MNINFFMNKAINMAKRAILVDEVPVGAVLVNNQTNKIIFSSHNLTNSSINSIMHAEIVVIIESCKILNSKFLNNTSIFITLEPCAMCAAAISEAHINSLYFGAYDEKKGSLESIMKIYNKKHFFVPSVYGGIEEKKCSFLLKNFFKQKRIK